MNITKKQLMDIISLSIMAVFDKEDGTADIPQMLRKDTQYPRTNFIAEALHILNDEDIIESLNDHVRAIRLGVKLGRAE